MESDQVAHWLGDRSQHLAHQVPQGAELCGRLVRR